MVYCLNTTCSREFLFLEIFFANVDFCFSDDGNIDQLTALASELKVLTHLGSHINILNVLGAITSELEIGISLMFVFCKASIKHKATRN